jgi:hypothetical protein
MKQLERGCADFYEIWYFGVFIKFVNTFQFRLNDDDDDDDDDNNNNNNNVWQMVHHVKSQGIVMCM